MDEKKNPVDAFDYLYTTNHIQLLKTALPYLSGTMQPFLAVIIKYMELNYTISLLHHPLYQSQSSPHDKKNMNAMLTDIAKYLTDEEKKQVKQMQSMMQSMEQVKQMQEMMHMFDGFSSTDQDSPFASYFSDFDQFMKGKDVDNSNIYPFQQNASNSTAPPEKKTAPAKSPLDMLSMLQSASSDAVTDAINQIFPPKT